MLEIDHVILAVPSMDAALAQLADEYGLVGIPTSADEAPIETAIVPFENEQYDLANQLPFFIEYLGGTGNSYLKGLRLRSAGEPMGLRFAKLSLSADPTRLAEWLGADLSSLQVHEGDSGLRSIGIETRKGTITISHGS